MAKSGDPAPVIAIDGPSASGKGTVAQEVARSLGFHYLDSGALYRLVAVAAARQDVALADENRLAALAGGLACEFCGDQIRLDGQSVTDAVRSEQAASGASEVAALPQVRRALLERQRAFRRVPGLVADGRDMGSVVFPDAVLKIFLTASPEERANRRYKQLMEKGLRVNLINILRDIEQRDARDIGRPVAPLQVGADAMVVDTTNLTVAEAVARILESYAARQSRQAPSR